MPHSVQCDGLLTVGLGTTLPPAFPNSPHGGDPNLLVRKRRCQSLHGNIRRTLHGNVVQLATGIYSNPFPIRKAVCGASAATADECCVWKRNHNERSCTNKGRRECLAGSRPDCTHLDRAQTEIAESWRHRQSISLGPRLALSPISRRTP